MVTKIASSRDDLIVPQTVASEPEVVKSGDTINLSIPRNLKRITLTTCSATQSKASPRSSHSCPTVLKLARIEGGITCHAPMPTSSTAAPAPFGLVGISHKTAPLELRSAFSLTKEQLPDLLRRAKAAGLSECVALATCNRTELYFVGADGLIAAQLLAEHAGMSIEDLKSHLYERSCVCAACHLFRVSAGLDSAVLGETEIASQVKEAWAIAEKQKMVGPMLDLLFKRAREASKRIRSETELCKSVVSTAALAVREAVLIAGPLECKTLSLLGAGKIAARLAKELATVPCAKSIVVNRTPEKAEWVARKMKAEVRGSEELKSSLEESDVVFAAVGAGHSVIDMSLLAEVMSKRADRPLVIVDLGVPPNVAQGNRPPGVRVIGLEDLSAKSAEGAANRLSSVQPSLQILDEEIGRFCEGLIEKAASPTIRALLKLGESVRQRNLEWARQRLPDLDEQHLKVIDELTRRTIIGLLESPIHTLKTDTDWNERTDLVERLFALNGGE